MDAGASSSNNTTSDSSMIDKTLGLKTMKISDIKRHDYLTRIRHSETVQTAMASVIKYGLLSPPVFNVRSGHLMSQVSIVEAYKILSKTEIDVWCVDLDETQELAACLMLNNHLNDFNWEQVAADLKKIQAAGLSLALTGLQEFDTGPLLAAEWNQADAGAISAQQAALF